MDSYEQLAAHFDRIAEDNRQKRIAERMCCEDMTKQRNELLAALKACDQIIRDVTLMMPERIVKTHNLLKASIAKAEGKVDGQPASG